MARISAAQQYGWTDNLNVNRFATYRSRYLEEKEEVKNCVSRKVKLIGYPVSKKYLDNMEMWEYLEYLVISWDVV